MEINLTVSIEEVNALLQVLGEKPTSSGVFPLMVKLQQQAQAQIPQEGQAPPAPEAAEG